MGGLFSHGAVFRNKLWEARGGNNTLSVLGI